MTRRRDARANAWYDVLYPLYLRYGWHPACAAIEAHLGAQRRTRPVTR